MVQCKCLSEELLALLVLLPLISEEALTHGILHYELSRIDE
jgi:hypothetical protein